MEVTGIFISSKMVNVSFRLKATPSMMARITCARVWEAVRPIRAARALGSRCGVRSPIRYGTQNAPSEAAGGAGFFGEDVVGIASIFLLHSWGGGAEVVTIPAQGEACG